MRVIAKNIGPINKADIELNKITVVAAENSTGKSSLSKLVYCSINSINNLTYLSMVSYLSEVIDCLDYIYERLVNNDVFEDQSISETKSVSKDKFGLIKENIISDVVALKYQTSSSLSDFKDYVDKIKDGITHKDFESIQVRVKKLEDLKIKGITEFDAKSMESILFDQFRLSLVRSGSDGAQFSVLENGNEILDVSVDSNNNVTSCKRKYSDIKHVTYIDNPYVLDNCTYLDDKSFRLYERITKKDSDLYYKLTFNSERVSSNKCNEVLSRIDSIIGGTIGYSDDKSKSIVYRVDDLYDIPMKNTATGIKPFGILKLLGGNGYFDESNLVIIDEPEVHLHPIWQVKFAELLIDLSLNYGVNFMINTHSTYFVEAINAFSRTKNFSDSVNYYMIERGLNGSKVVDNENTLQEIYKVMNTSYSLLDEAISKFTFEGEE